MGLNVEQYPPFRVNAFNSGYRQTGYGEPEGAAREGGTVRVGAGLPRPVHRGGLQPRPELRHRLEAQSVVWALVRGLDEPPWMVQVTGKKLSMGPVWMPSLQGPTCRSLFWRRSGPARRQETGYIPGPARHRQDLYRAGSGRNPGRV